MATMDMDVGRIGSSLPADSLAKSLRLVWGLVAT